MVLTTFYKDKDKDKQPVLDLENFRNFGTFAYED